MFKAVNKTTQVISKIAGVMSTVNVAKAALRPLASLF